MFTHTHTHTHTQTHTHTHTHTRMHTRSQIKVNIRIINRQNSMHVELLLYTHKLLFKIHVISEISPLLENLISSADGAVYMYSLKRAAVYIYKSTMLNILMYHIPNLFKSCNKGFISCFSKFLAVWQQ